jgi:hypothetical protein
MEASMPDEPYTVVPRLEEPEPTEEDLRALEDLRRRLDEERRAAIEAGERLPPLDGEALWKTED